MKIVLLMLGVATLITPCFAAMADAGETRPTKQAAERAARLKAEAKSFRLDLAYSGEQDKPYYGLTLSVPVVPRLAIDPFHPVVQISEEEAVRLIDHLTVDGFLDRARGEAPGKPPAGPCYTLTVRADGKSGPLVYHEDFGWGAPMLKRLDGIRGSLKGKAAEAMDLLLGRLGGHRMEWTREQKK
jgi:hypothetical protein